MNVSNEELLIDIKNTQDECLAYGKISDGYYILSQLPENQGIKQREYLEKFIYFSNLYKDCNDFLMSLLAIKEDRNL